MNKTYLKRKINLTDCVFCVMQDLRRGTELGEAINNAANIYGNSYEEYMKIWCFLKSLIW